MLDRAGGAKEMTERCLGGCHGGAAEDLPDRVRLGNVADRGPGGMGVDVADLPGSQTGLRQGLPHGRDLTGSVSGGRRDVVGVGGDAGAGEHRVDARAPGAGMLGAFQHHDSRAFAEDESAAVRGERPGR